ncbi:MAG TPA: hypothetical protein VN698_07770 [Bacteroidia bacterium]|nr:hypothetical protein [Bacteroidia bacterium]
MRKLPLQLNTQNQTTNQVSLEFVEDYLYIQLHQFLPEHFLTITTKIRDQETTKIIQCAKIIRVNVFGYTSFKLSGNLINDEKIEGQIHMGTWDEIIIQDLATNLDHHYQSFHDNKNQSFQIGLDTCAHLKVISHDTEHYSLIRKITLPNGGAGQKDKFIHKRSDIGLQIELIYKQIKQNLQNQNFVTQQTHRAHELQQKTIEFCKFY